MPPSRHNDKILKAVREYLLGEGFVLRRSIVQSTLLTSLYLIITLIGQGCDGAASPMDIKKV
jgi:hypothetical protein